MHPPFPCPDVYADDVALAERLASAAWAAIAPHFRNATAVDNKADAGFDPVTEADRGGERAIREVLKAERPHDAIWGEEFGIEGDREGRCWLLDPVDGTRAFVAGLPSWTTLIALCDGLKPVIGVIDQPVLGERYVGWPGGAAMRCRDGSVQTLKVSACTDLRQAVLSTTDPFIMTPAEQGAFTHLRATAPITRYGLDAYGYARLAAGTIDMVTETGLQPYDMAALIPVVTGAGGLACNWRGEPANILHGQLACAATQELLDHALVALRRSAD
jgi:histidinol phosphatase-like enzyme (inositol monophosphatase family)